MSTYINIMRAGDVRATAFSPLNNMALTIQANDTSVTYFGMPAEIAWTMFDMLRDGQAAFHFRDEAIHALESDPQASAALIAKARAETLPVLTEAAA